MIVSTTHETFYVEPWEELPGGVRVSHVDDPDLPVMLLRDRTEVHEFTAALLATQAESQTAVR